MENQAAARTALFIAILAGFLTPFDLSGVNIALPRIGAEFAMDAVALSWVPTAYLLASAIFLVPFGRIADIYGRKKVFVSGLSIFTFSSLLMVFSISPLMIILLRIVQGMGSALIFGTAVAILTSSTPPQRRGRALGIYTASVYLGLTLGPFLGGFMTQHLGWRSIFLINVPLGIFTVVLILWKLKGEWADAKGEGFDYIGTLLYAVTLVAFVYGLSELPTVSGGSLILASFVILGMFLWWESGRKCPLIDLQLFRENRVFALSNLAALINYGATFSVTFFLSLYLQYIRGFTPEQAGLILVIQPLIMAVLSSPAGRLSDRVDPGRVASVGMALNAVGLFFLIFLDAATPLPFLLVALVILGFGFALFASPNTNAIMGSVTPKCYGVASGTMGTMRLVGQMLSMGIAIMIFALVIGRVEITPMYYQAFLTSMKFGFLLFTIICFLGIYPSLARGKVTRT
ncbi:MAG: MFS transporter [Methanomicrobiales archaeon]|nr:MFS transporter [Methanomicrobiales archaeon]